MDNELDIDLTADLHAGAQLHAAVQPDIAQEINEAVEKWIRDELHNGPIARNTEAWNHLIAAKESLKRQLLSLFLKGI